MPGDTPTEAESGAGTDGPSLPWEGSFPPTTVSIRHCRNALAGALGAAGIAPDVIADALVVVSELAGNAVRHARTEFTVSATLQAGKLRLEVGDSDTRPPALLGLDSESTSGRGLHLVAAIARDWGWQSAADTEGISGKRVWAELVSQGPEADPR